MGETIDAVSTSLMAYDKKSSGGQRYDMGSCR